MSEMRVSTKPVEPAEPQSTLWERLMRFHLGKWFSLAALIGGLVVLVVIAAAAMPLVGLPPVRDWWKKPAHSAESAAAAEAVASAELVPGQADILRLPPAVVKELGIGVSEVKELSVAGQLQPPHRPSEGKDPDGWTKAQVTQATKARVLHLPGTLGFDTNNFAPVRSRFPGEVVEIGTVQERLGSVRTVSRPLRYGDQVAKGQLLVAVWNTDLGNKKNDLVDAIYQQKLDQEILKRAEDKAEVVPEVFLLNARRNVQADNNAINRAVRTLRTWRVPDEEIEAVKQEAKRIIERRGKRDPAKEEAWPRVEMRAPFDGVIVEKTVGLHSYVDTSTDLFKIAQLEKLAVYAYAYEEDLPALQALPPEQRRWQIRLQNEPNAKPLPGTIDQIGFTIDPTQHTGVVMGAVDNHEEQLKVGQFIIADVALPPEKNEVVIPTTALVEDGRESVVFVQPDVAKPYYRQEQVTVARREHQVVFLRPFANSADPQKQHPLEPGKTWVVSSGAVELKAALEDLLSRAKQK
jgi:cobalt-zinc-cadmium efflux system membrane fusion protein